MKDNITIKVYQHDWIPGFAAFANYKEREDGDNAHVLLNLGCILAMVQEGECEKQDVPYIVAESLMHEVVHALEQWASVEFNEDRVDELIEKYREKYADVQD